MNISSLIKSVLKRSDAPVKVVEEEPEEVIQMPVIPRFNKNMPIELLDGFRSVLFTGRLGEFNTRELSMERIPGEISFPILDVGSQVLIRGYDTQMNPIVLQATVFRSTLTECVLGECRFDAYENQRKDVRYPLTPSASIYAMKDTRLLHPQECKLINISVGGACIESDFNYEMGQVVRLWVELVKDGGHSSYVCQVVRVSPRGDGNHEYGLLFAQLDNRKMNGLMRDIEIIKKDIERKLAGL